MVYRIFWFTIGPLIKAYWFVRARGRGNVPKGGIIVAANHHAAIDPVLVCMSFWRPVHWLAKGELVQTKRVAWVFRGAGVGPVARQAPQEVPIYIATPRLKPSKIFRIFPQGTRNPHGRR